MINNTINLFFVTEIGITVSECCLIKLLPYISFEEEYIYILALETASPGNEHCVNCIGTLSFPIRKPIAGPDPGGPREPCPPPQPVMITFFSNVWLPVTYVTYETYVWPHSTKSSNVCPRRQNPGSGPASYRAVRRSKLHSLTVGHELFDGFQRGVDDVDVVDSKQLVANQNSSARRRASYRFTHIKKVKVAHTRLPSVRFRS